MSISEVFFISSKQLNAGSLTGGQKSSCMSTTIKAGLKEPLAFEAAILSGFEARPAEQRVLLCPGKCESQFSFRGPAFGSARNGFPRKLWAYLRIYIA